MSFSRDPENVLDHPSTAPTFNSNFVYPPPYPENSDHKPPMNQEEFDTFYRYQRPNRRHGVLKRNLLRASKRYWKPFTSCNLFLGTFLSFFPILKWLPKYQWKNWIIGDIIGGITLSVMHVPQGIAYAVLAKVQPVVGLYTSLFPILLYMIFGTSMHNSLGSFAVVSLMAGKSAIRICGAEPEVHPLDNETMANWTGLEAEAGTGMSHAEFEKCSLQVVSTLAFVVGLVHLMMGFLRLEILVTYLSDQLIAGFSVASSFHVMVTQLPALFGIQGVPEPLGIGHLFAKFFDTISRFTKANVATSIVGLLSMAFLVIGKDHVNPWLKGRFQLKVPLPFELILISFTTLLSYLLDFHSRFHVKVVAESPTGLPSVHFPRIDKLDALLVDALSIAFVVIAIHISLVKMFGKKLGYQVHFGQELYALGLSSTLASFFPIYPVCCSLGRTMISVEAGTKTQLSSVFSSLVIVIVIAYAGVWLEPLPMCVLSATVIVALKGMAKKFSDLPTLWSVSKIDFSIWLVSFLATVGWDVTQGLAIAVMYALLTTVLRSQFPRYKLLGLFNGATNFEDSERYLDVTDQKGIFIYRFDSPLLFTNVDKFNRGIAKSLKTWGDRLGSECTVSWPEGVKIDERHLERIHSVLSVETLVTVTPEKPEAGILYKHLIIDCSGFTFVDYMGVNALKEVFSEMREQKVLVYFAAAKAPVRDLFEASGFYKYVPKSNFYPTIRDAVATARKRRNDSTVFLLDEMGFKQETLEQEAEHQPMNLS